MKEELKGKVVDLSGNFVREITLPPVFMEEYRPDLIKNAGPSITFGEVPM